MEKEQQPTAMGRPRTKASIAARDSAIEAAKTHSVKTRWVKYPSQERWTNAGTAGTFAGRINKGDMWGSDFEARVSKGVLWVRFVG